MKRKTQIWIGVVLVVLIGIRAILPLVIKDQLNKFLADFSPVYAFHVDDVDLSILRGAYRLEGITGDLKKSNKQFFGADYIDISVAWRDLIRGHLRTDIIGTGVEFTGNQQFLQSLKDQSAASAKKDAQELGDKVFPLRISRIDLRNSKATFADVNGLPEELQLRLTQIDGRVSNVTATENEPNSLINIRGVLQDSAAAVIVGEIDQKSTPAEYLFSFQLKEFDVTSLNPFLKRRVPLTFSQGRADIYAEVKGEEGNVYGYVKPFLKNAKMMGDQGDFKGVKHWSIEVAAAFGNMLLKSADDKTVATKFNYAYEAGEFKWNLGQVLGKAFAHGFGGDEVQPGLENQFEMKEKRTRKNSNEKAIKESKQQP